MSHLYTLPSRYILKRFKPDLQQTHPDLAIHKDDAILITTTQIGFQERVYEMEIQQNPIEVLGNSIILHSTSDIWFGGEKVVFTVKHAETMMKSVFTFNDIILDTIYGHIPVLKQSEPCQLFGNLFKFLHTDLYESYRFKCTPGTVLVAPENPAGGGGGYPIPVEKGKVPQHILNVYIQSLLDKEENCPIQMVPLTKETVRITPCGHAMSASAAEYWITYKHSCPVCRQNCSVEELQKWN